MKTVSVLAAVAALVAGVSVASAQNSTGRGPATPPSSLNKGDLPHPQSGSQPAGTQNMGAPAGTTGTGMKSPAAQSQDKAKSPASTDAGIKQEK
jgi:hypothetical protein